MRTGLKIISFLALALTVVPSFLYLNGSVGLDSAKLLMLIATVAWFVASPFWINRKDA